MAEIGTATVKIVPEFEGDMLDDLVERIADRVVEKLRAKQPQMINVEQHFHNPPAPQRIAPGGTNPWPGMTIC